jgi:alanyl-tRNA synthetase
MAKKERIPIQRPGNLESIDLELDEALGRLDGANERITSLLQSIETANVADETKVYAEEGGDEADEGDSSEEADEADGSSAPDGE